VVKKLDLKQKINFGSGNATITRASYPTLDAVAKTLAAHPEVKTIRIEGHTDDVGADAANQKLSQRRAEAVKTYLSKKGGIDPARMEAKGFGESNPVMPGKTKAAREANRRVEIYTVE
jgi:outer membrane protein OmpA-like peptidoglycan-associated protein